MGQRRYSRSRTVSVVLSTGCTFRRRPCKASHRQFSINYYGVDYGKPARSGALLQAIYDYSLELEAAEPKIGYVATSLPVMLLFEEDMRLRNPDRGILPSCAGLVRVWANGHGQTASGDSTPRGSQSRRRCFGIVPRVRRYLSGRSGTDLLRCSLNKRTFDRRHGTTAVQKRKSS